MHRFLKVLIVAIIFFSTAQSCKNEKEEETKGGLKAVFKRTKIINPSSNEKIALGDDVTFEVSMKSDSNLIDSVKLFFEDLVIDGDGLKATINTGITGVGRPRLILNVYLSDGKKETHYPKVRVMPPAPKSYTYQARNAFPHDKYNSSELVV